MSGCHFKRSFERRCTSAVWLSWSFCLFFRPRFACSYKTETSTHENTVSAKTQLRFHGSGKCRQDFLRSRVYSRLEMFVWVNNVSSICHLGTPHSSRLYFLNKMHIRGGHSDSCASLPRKLSIKVRLVRSARVVKINVDK